MWQGQKAEWERAWTQQSGAGGEPQNFREAGAAFSMENHPHQGVVGLSLHVARTNVCVVGTGMSVGVSVCFCGHLCV